MKYLINLVKLILVILLSVFIFGSLSYFNIISDNISSIIELFIFFVSLFLISYKLGKEKEKNGYQEGIIFGVITTLLFILINIIFKNKINNTKIVYYLLIIFISAIGSILGINKKTKV